MNERPKEAMEWLRKVGTSHYWTHPNPPITLVDQAKARRNEILTELMQYVDLIEAENTKLKRQLDRANKIMVELNLECDRLEAAIADWKKEEILWKERETELLADSKRLDKLERVLLGSLPFETKLEGFWFAGNKISVSPSTTIREAIDKLEETEGKEKNE